ncbi:hypothetical protein SO802_011993 [Lithocarpus litseifolius]|uniref:Cytochrome P450 71A1 n=1 Tax=Lithocarpus litseifolius TaxID=425828 RepID=A0AAW2D1I8_9ROSI
MAERLTVTVTETTVTTGPPNNRSPPPPHRHAPPLLGPTRPKTRPHNPSPTRPSPHHRCLLSSPSQTRPQNPRPRFRKPTEPALGSVPLLQLLRRHFLTLRSLLAPSQEDLRHRVAQLQTGQLVPTRQGRGGESVAGLRVGSVRVGSRPGFKEESGEDEGQKRHLVGVLTETQALFAGFCLGDFFPGWDWVDSLSGYTKRLSKNLGDLRAVCEEIIEEHLKEQGVSNGKEDFVDVLLRVQQRKDLEVPITDDNLKALVLDMFVAGTDTSSATLEWTMTELARNPMVMKKAQDEVRNVASSLGKVEESHLQHLHYLKAVIKETMRLHPPVPLLVPRESMEKCNLDGYEIPAKTRVLINTYAIGRDPTSWENPLEYNPERFMDKNIEVKDQDFRFLPFGGGRRGCPGYSFGLATVEIALARLLYHFDWALPQGVGADAMDLGEIFGLATRKKTAIVLVPTANKQYEFKG